MARSSTMSFSAAIASALMSTLIVIGINLASVRAFEEDAPYAKKDWTEAHATFYGGADGAGTMGGACGYGDLYTTGYGTDTAALSSVLFNEGMSCGACFEIKCILEKSKWCYPNAGSVKITGTNICPTNWDRVTDGWCNPPQSHFDLSYPVFATLAQRVGGIIPVQYRRISCVKQGGIRYMMQGNPWFNLVLVFNVAGAGNVVVLEMKGSETDFFPMTRNWGQNWELKQKLSGQAISFRATLGDSQQLTSTNVAPETWSFGQSYECFNNF